MITLEKVHTEARLYVLAASGKKQRSSRTEVQQWKRKGQDSSRRCWGPGVGSAGLGTVWVGLSGFGAEITGKSPGLLLGF